MQRSIATVSLSGTLPEKLQAIAAVGFDGVEIFENDLLNHNGSPRQVRQLCADLGIAITLFQPFSDFEGCRREHLQRNLDRAERKFDLMQELGTDLMLVCSNTAIDSLGEPNILRSDLESLAERAGARQLRVGYEGLAWGRHVNTWQQVWDVVRQVDHPALGVLLDSFHTLALKGDPSAIAQIPGDKIFYVQMADAPLLNMDVLEWSRHFRCFPGQGEFDCPGFLAAILRSGYNGPLSLEIFNDVFRAAPTRANAADGLRSLLYLEEQTRALLEQESQPVAPSLLFDPPAPSACNAFAFLEFAVDDAQGARLGSWLHGLGFGTQAQHRSKAVTVLGQGDIRIVLNAERFSLAQMPIAAPALAHAVLKAHGPSLCAMALRVDDSAAALERARQFNAQTGGSPLDPDQRACPAVRAPDGSLIYLVEAAAPEQSIWSSEFTLSTQTPRQSGLQRIDHVAMALSADTLDSQVLYYKSVLDFKADADVLLPDPHGLVKSRAVRSHCGTVRLSLNASAHGNTAISHALSSYGGSGVHHVAFVCSDIFMQVARAKAAGVQWLAIPLNYYDDLAARFGFDEAFLSELAHHNVLYDRDAQGGELFHACTQTFEERFFVEILQRRNGYAGYGEPNAAVRLTAMARARSGSARC
ncbi:bifunctional sugar phosphate isomerase/epimerase/4-hydroxyphenylpyruvate dioxygenase family protein [Pseudomonas sp.]|jgi:4-hydroxyphenylpyruvate dioxygenase|uniref:bifunctional sugar phosphate isomerase/epimerase/4-hydroxyphenylpyruvate dioxygenase family protein n=1 Tax=Pseudomonas sp. TaxID=306 RepID=UPI002ED980BA